MLEFNVALISACITKNEQQTSKKKTKYND